MLTIYGKARSGHNERVPILSLPCFRHRRVTLRTGWEKCCSSNGDIAGQLPIVCLAVGFLCPEAGFAPYPKEPRPSGEVFSSHPCRRAGLFGGTLLPSGHEETGELLLRTGEECFSNEIRQAFYSFVILISTPLPPTQAQSGCKPPLFFWPHLPKHVLTA